MLYIVSAKEPDIVPTLYTSLGPDYVLGAVVYDIPFNDGIKYYYESLTDDNNFPLPDQSNQYWLYIGLEKDFINRYGFIEFGSYPSPEVVNADRLDTSLPYEIVNDVDTVPEDFKMALYSPQIINNSPFRAGVYVQFTPNATSLYTGTTTFRAYTYNTTTGIVEPQNVTKAIYKVRLLHQLTNGFIDLTDDVWEKYAIYYKTSTGFDLNTDTFAHGIHYWFTDPNFKYYCPHNFKGKLALTVELEELDMFSITPLAIDIVAGNYVITFTVSYSNSAAWNVDIDPQTVTLVYTTDGSEPDYINLPLTTTIVLNQAIPTFTFTLGPALDYQGLLLKYKILPEFYYQMAIIDRQFFPQKFLDMHTIVGSKLIATETQEMAIKLETTTNNCEIGNNGYRTLEKISLVDGQGFYIDNTGEPSGNNGTDKYQFMLDTSPLPVAPDVWVAKYTYDPISGKAIVNAYNEPTYGLLNKEYLTSLIEAETVRIYDPTCAFVTLTVNTSSAVTATDIPITVAQSGNNRVVNKVNNKQFTCQVEPGLTITITPRSGYGVYTTPYTMSGGISVDSSVNIGLVVDLRIATVMSAVPNISDHTFVNIPDALFGDDILYGTGFNQFSAVQTDGHFEGSILTTARVTDGEASAYNLFGPYAIQGSFKPHYTITFNNATTTNYWANLIGQSI